MKLLLLLGMLYFLLPSSLFAATGCDLNDPDRDVKRLFPTATGFKTLYMSLDKIGGNAVLTKIEQRLGDTFTGLYETVDVPYTIYEIFRGTQKIGYIHGVNQKGEYGGIQVFVALDLNGVITNFYFQKLTNRRASAFRSQSFTSQFIGLSLKDFYNYNIKTNKATGTSRVLGIKNTASAAYADFRATLRATKKNLILMDEFMLGNRHLKYFK